MASDVFFFLGFCRLTLKESSTATPDPFLLSAPDGAAEVGVLFQILVYNDLLELTHFFQ